VKLQTYTPDTITIDCDKEWFRLAHGTIWDGTTFYELYTQAYMPWEWHEALFDYARELGIEIFSTPFDKTAVDFLEKFNTPRYKIASFEITDTPLIEYVASKGKPIIISIGIATLEEIEDAVQACKNQGNNKITLLQCTSEYPAKPEDANLATMLDLKERFQVDIGLSDHTMGHEVTVLATAMGASIIEKHFTLDRGQDGPDASFSMNPQEMTELVKQVRRVELVRGKADYELTEAKKRSRASARSLFIVEDVKKGDIISERNVRSIRPGNGLSPKHVREIIGRTFRTELERGTPLSWEHIE